MAKDMWREVKRIESSNRILRNAGRRVLAAYQQFLDNDDLDRLRDALTELQDALDIEDAMENQ